MNNSLVLGEPGLIYGRTSLSEIHFGSGGSSATSSNGAGKSVEQIRCIFHDNLGIMFHNYVVGTH